MVFSFLVATFGFAKSVATGVAGALVLRRREDEAPLIAPGKPPFAEPGSATA